MKTSDKAGEMTSVGCSVVSCAHNSNGRYCALSHIEVRPCVGCTGCGAPDEESFCGSYSMR
ncbi:MAG: DUF1540 domain-containing protein [Clostridia bacterium]|nr:DUF1540 domain-containing protein [Clostridia bacterium]MBQ2517572.1 DUF1540 domain-containing protein [Clostridia bacterium]MBQ4341602.1 DUF1540 domain-containing protein [Clostridia bacterium]MBR6429329.1 DUF1540 domain-containing protein [Clostridia bacterium]